MACGGGRKSTPPYWMDVEQPAGEAAEGHLEHLGGGGSQGTHQGGLALVDVGLKVDDDEILTICF